MSLYILTLPISAYDPEDVKTYKDLYFQSETCPTEQDVIRFLQQETQKEERMMEEHPEYGPFLFEYQECLNSIAEIKDFPHLSGRHVLSGIPYMSERLGNVSITMKKVDPFIILCKTCLSRMECKHTACEYIPCEHD